MTNSSDYVIGLIVGCLVTLVAFTISLVSTDHNHVKARHLITNYKTAPVTYCYTEDKIVAYDGEHLDFKNPVILYPEKK